MTLKEFLWLNSRESVTPVISSYDSAYHYDVVLVDKEGHAVSLLDAIKPYSYTQRYIGHMCEEIEEGIEFHNEERFYDALIDFFVLIYSVKNNVAPESGVRFSMPVILTSSILRECDRSLFLTALCSTPEDTSDFEKHIVEDLEE